MELKSWELRNAVGRIDSLLHRILAHMDGQFRTRRGMLFDVNFGSFKMCFPSSVWKDSRVLINAVFSTHDSEPYMRTGKTQHSTILQDERGFSKSCRHPVDCGEESMCFMNLFSNILFVGGSRILPDTKTLAGRQVSSIETLDEGTCFWTETKAPGLGERINTEDWLNSILNISSTARLNVISIGKGPKEDRKVEGESTNPWQIPRLMLKGFDSKLSNFA